MKWLKLTYADNVASDQSEHYAQSNPKLHLPLDGRYDHALQNNGQCSSGSDYVYAHANPRVKALNCLSVFNIEST